MKRMRSVHDFSRVFFYCCCAVLLCSGVAWAQEKEAAEPIEPVAASVQEFDPSAALGLDKDRAACTGDKDIDGVGTATWDQPFKVYYKDSRTTSLYLASEFGCDGGPISGMRYYIATYPTGGYMMNNLTIRLKHTTATTLTSTTFDNSGWTVCYQASTLIPAAAGWYTFTFTTPFTYVGGQNLLVDVSFNNSTYASVSYFVYRYASTTGNRTLYKYCDDCPCVTTDPLTWTTCSGCTLTTYIPRAQFIFPPATTGACCVSYVCYSPRTQSQCTAMGGTWYGGQDCYPAGTFFCPPWNDNCGNVPPETLTPGVPLTFSGDNRGATNDCSLFSGGQVWHSFTIPTVTSFFDVYLDYCMTSPAFGNAWLNLAVGCPCTSITAAGISDTVTCGNGNFTIKWYGLAPGTYYYPVMLDASHSAAGPYTIRVVAYPGYCASSATNTADETIKNVTFGTINNTTTDCDKYNDFTSISTNVLVGTTSPVSLTIGDCEGASCYSKQAAIYIDWNHDYDFTDTGELVWQSGQLTNSPCPDMTVTGNITVPPGATLGATRMRVIVVEGTTLPSPCGTYTWGATEDYGIVVVQPTTGACCWPNGHCSIETEMVCLQLSGVYYAGQTCGTVLPVAYHWEYPLNEQILPGAAFMNEEDGEDSTPIGKIRIDLKLIGILGPVHISVEHLGTTVVLWNGVCQSSDGMDVIFDDDAVGTIDCLNLTGGVPVSPASAGGGHLSDFKGMEFGGPWIIRIYSEQYIIIIVRWSLWVQFLDQTFICVPTPLGACCLRDGTCVHTSQADCSARNGTSWQYAVPCSYAGCQPVTGACCIGWECSIQQQDYCVNTLHGRYLGDNTTCDTLVRKTYPGLAIPDNIPAGVNDTMNVQYDVTVSNVKVDVVITHTFIGDLIIKLTHGTTTVTLWSRACTSNDNMNVIFDDAGSSVTCASPTIGTITPSSVGGGLLSAFNGQSGRGDWILNVSDNASLDTGTLVQWSLHFGNTNPCAILDTVVCEPQPPNHPNTYWYDVTPGDFGRCDFHVRVYDPNPANYTNPSLPAATWQFLVHQVGTEWWASWWDPGCTNAIFGPNATRFQFTNPNASVWGDWRTTIGGNSDPYDVWNIDHSGHHTAETDGYGYHVHVPTFAENWFWKDCNGNAVADGYMPDFDQRQDFNGDGLVEAGYCGPTAIANSLWWFNCKFPLAGIVPAGWTPLNLIQDLAQRMDTNDQNPPSPHGHAGPFAGTYMDDIAGRHQCLPDGPGCQEPALRAHGDQSHL